MARARNIKPSFFLNEELVELPFATRLLFIGLWTLADRDGRLEDKPKKIKMSIFPADNLDVNSMLDELNGSGFILRYVIDSIQYIQVLSFEKHQNPHRDEKESTIPAPCKHHASTVQTLCKDGASMVSIGLNPESFNLIPDSLLPNTETVEPAKPKKSKPVTPSASPFVLPDQIPTDEFNAFVEMRKAAKKAMTGHAKDLLVKQLLGFAQSGYDLKAILNASIMGGWSGVYEPKTKPSLPGAVSSSLGIHGQATAENAKRFIERQMQKESAGVS